MLALGPLRRRLRYRSAAPEVKSALAATHKHGETRRGRVSTESVHLCCSHWLNPGYTDKL
uniref:Uncharacterized protein n=1 Tax=Anguilla anguilla TaxID=7936 RepID=A0A0E9QF60_ANGAN